MPRTAATTGSRRDARALERDQESEDLIGPVFLASPDADVISVEPWR